MRTCNPRRNVGNGMEAKSGRGDSCEQSPTNDFLTLSVGKPGGGSPCDGPCWSRAFNVETGATRAHVPPSNIEGADRTRATRLPSLLYPLLRPLVVLFRSFPWTLVQTDAASFLAGCQEAFVGPCSYFAPLPRSAGLSPAALGGAPPLPAAHSPSLPRQRRAHRRPFTGGRVFDVCDACSSCSGGVCVADKRVALEPCTPHLLPVWHGRSYSPGRCAFRTRASGGVTKVLDCLPFGSFWTSFW